MSLTLQHTQETLCLCHIYALAGMAGLDWAIRQVYDYGVDGEFRQVTERNNRRCLTGYALDFQAKATVNWKRRNSCIVYDLEAKTYNDMVSRQPEETSLILILLCLPKEKDEWHGAEPEQTTLRHGCYWYSLTGETTENTSSRVIHIPIENLLTPSVLNNLMEHEKQRKRSLR